MPFDLIPEQEEKSPGDIHNSGFTTIFAKLSVPVGHAIAEIDKEDRSKNAFVRFVVDKGRVCVFALLDETGKTLTQNTARILVPRKLANKVAQELKKVSGVHGITRERKPNYKFASAPSLPRTVRHAGSASTLAA